MAIDARRPIHKILNSIHNNNRTREYECRKLLESWEDRGIHYEICLSAPFAELWERTFPVTEEMTANAPDYNDEFLWHRFSFEVLPHKAGDDAKKKFDEMEKSALILFHHDQEESMLLTGCGQLRSTDVMELWQALPFLKTDLYIIPVQNPEWTFVVTHEENLGPYFAEASDCSAVPPPLPAQQSIRKNRSANPQ